MEFIPDNLVKKCIQLVHFTHRKIGTRTLPAKISFSGPSNMVALAAMERTTAVLKRAKLYAKMALVLRTALLAVPVLAWIYHNYWILAAIVVIVGVERSMIRQEKEDWMFLSSVLLSLEMLVHDFAGWGRAHPEARKRASGVLGKKIVWLEYYLPHRHKLDPAQLREFGPKI
jgi:hypothetical protein